MNDNPIIYGNCAAGCKWRVPSYEEFQAVRKKRGEISVSISPSNWTTNANISPFVYIAKKTITVNTAVSSEVTVNIDPAEQATSGIVFAEYDPAAGTLLFYAVAQPASTITVTAVVETIGETEENEDG